MLLNPGSSSSFVMVRWNDEKEKLEFIEVKVDTYVEALRAKLGSGKDSGVIAQMNQYRSFLHF